jgi:hypothetical protein
MQTKHFFRASLALAFLFILFPNQSHAYGVTDRHITRLSDTLTMYTLTFEFGFLNADMWMPLASSKTLKAGNQTASLVLSKAPIQDEKYFVPMKSNAEFTLLVLEQHEVGKSKGSVTIEKLPITIQKKGEEKQIKVFTKEELKDFTIPKQ